MGARLLLSHLRLRAVCVPMSAARFLLENCLLKKSQPGNAAERGGDMQLRYGKIKYAYFIMHVIFGQERKNRQSLMWNLKKKALSS